MQLQDKQRYRGWLAYTLESHFLTVYITPALGGRIMQVQMGDYPYFFNNQTLHGAIPGDEHTDQWLNYGGEKIWPAPQGWGLPDHWPGPPDPVLDGGPYDVLTHDSESGNNFIRMRSQADPYTGLQIEKDIHLSEHRSGVSIHATFHNTSAVVRRWSIWPVLQLNTPDPERRTSVVSCAMAPDSQFAEGYKVMHGLVNNPQFGRDGHNNLLVSYEYIVGKVGLDSRANWAAYTDTLNGYVLVATFNYEENAVYPEGTSVQIWTQGSGQVYSRNEVKNFPHDPTTNQPYLEIELLSPLFTIAPGESASFAYQISCCRVPTHFHVVRKTAFSVAVSSLRISMESGELRIRGKYGVFSEGILKIGYKVDLAPDVFTPIADLEVSPLQPVEIDVYLREMEIRRGVGMIVQLNLYIRGVFNETIDQHTYVVT
jgi:hypothetical protein